MPSQTLLLVAHILHALEPDKALHICQQGQGGVPNGDGGLLAGLGNPELFANMHKAGGHQTEFSIQNEQEFPALPTTTQPRDDQLTNQELQQGLQVRRISFRSVKVTW
jgi:hypothetical protein